MPTYVVKDPTSGRTVRLTGDSPPSEAELSQIFATMGKPQGAAVMVNGQPMAIEDYNQTQQAAPTTPPFSSGSQWVDRYMHAGPVAVLNGLQDLTHGQPSRGAANVIEGAGVTALPAAVPAAILNPATAVAGIGAGYMASRAAHPVARAMGATPDQERLVADVAGVAGGAGGVKAVGWMGNAASRMAATAPDGVKTAASDLASELLYPKAVKVSAKAAKLVQELSEWVLARKAETDPNVTVVDAGAPPPPDRTIRGYLNGSTAREMPASSLPDPSYVRAVPAQYPGRETPPVVQEPPYDPAAAQQSARADTARVVEQARSRWAAQRQAASPPVSAVPSRRASTPRAARQTTAAAPASAPATSDATTLSAEALAEFTKNPPTAGEAMDAEKWAAKGMSHEQILNEIYKARHYTAAMGTPTPDEAAVAASERAARSNAQRAERRRRRTEP